MSSTRASSSGLCLGDAGPVTRSAARGGVEVVEQVIRPTGLLDPVISVRPTKGRSTTCSTRCARCRGNKGQRAGHDADQADGRGPDRLPEGDGRPRRYLHTTSRRWSGSISCGLRLGVYDVVVGINLLREGLDLPEVSLVAILDADKEGFLRTKRSLIQTSGRAARHVDGLVIMYADRRRTR